MLMMSRPFVVLVAAMLCLNGYAQERKQADTFVDFPGRVMGRIESQARGIDQKLTRQTEKYLDRLQRQEEKIFRKLVSKDSTANKLLEDSRNKYATLKNKLAEKKDKLSNSVAGKYIPRLDTLTTSFKFLQNQQSPASENITKTLTSLTLLQDKLKQADQVKQFIRERKELLRRQLENVGLVKELKNFNKQAYYYTQLVRDYRTMLNDPQKLEQKAIGLLKKIPAFNDFLQKNSMLASLFSIPGGNIDPTVSTVGLLQSRAQVQGALQNQLQLSAAGPNPQRALQQGVQQAQQQLTRLRQQLVQWTGGNDDIEVPDFKPNPQRTKSFLQKFELGANIQSAKQNNLFPVSSDIGFSIGFKPSDKYIIGIGGSYKIGWGSSFRNIHITHQGVGLRSFLDLKLKKGLFISGGYEQNYFAEIKNIQQLKDFSGWKSSALLGLSKKYSIGKKKKGELKVLYDFFYARKIPRTQPVLFRVGYGL
jgi:hypothetical protein